MEGNSITAFVNLCRIFEMRIKLDREKGVKTSLDVLENYEKYSKKIDAIYNNEFQKELKPLISPAVTLEKEEDRLRRLIKLLEDRLDKRIELEDRFYNSTGKYITGLQMIVSETELEEKKQRLSLITNYLEINREIEDITVSINKLKDSLEKEEIKKIDYEKKNKILEDELYSSFINVVNNDEYYKNINEEDINNELESVRNKVSETKETLEITRESVGSLVNSGLEDDYTSYVEEAEKSYYLYKNREIILKIYKLVIGFEDDFKLICSKREKINELLNEKKNLSEEVSIDGDDELLSFEKTLLLQIKTLANEREIIENIANYNSRINFKEERLVELNEINNSSEILVILREYGLIDTYEVDDIAEQTFEEESLDGGNIISPEIELPTIEKPIIEKVYDPYSIVEVKDYPRTLNVGLAKLKGESVREKVNKKLNPKDDIKINGFNVIKENNIENIVPLEGKKENVLLVEDVLPLNTNGEVPLNTSTDTLENGVSVEDTDKLIVTPTFEESNVELPIWELPSDTNPKSISFKDEKINNLPVWDSIVPNFEKPKNIDDNVELNNFDIFSKPIENTNNNSNDMFWVPVSDSKLETKDFPNINIPMSNNFNGNDNFGFPTIDVEGE